MKILKGLIIAFVCLFALAAGIILYAENADYTFDKEKATAYATKNAEKKSRTWCAWYVMRALQEGGCPIYLLPAYGYSWLLPRMLPRSSRNRAGWNTIRWKSGLHKHR